MKNRDLGDRQQPRSDCGCFLQGALRAEIEPGLSPIRKAAATQLAQAIGLACVLGNLDAVGVVPVEAPTITTLEDLPYFARWIDSQAALAASVPARLYIENLPTRVVTDLTQGKVASGSTNGNHGRIVVEMGTEIRNLVSDWGTVKTNLDSLKVAVQSTNGEILAINLQNEEKLKQYAIQKMGMHMAITQEVAKAVSAWSGLNVIGGLAQSGLAASNVETLAQELSTLGELEGNAGDQKANAIAQAFIHLQQTTIPLYSNIQLTLTSIQNRVAKLAELSSQLRDSEQNAKYEAAKGLGADYAVIDGKVVNFPVNTVLRHEYDVTKLRYERSLKDARYMAYVARLAVEQRIGMRLNTIVDRVGPLDPPVQWADDVCKLKGIKYDQYRDRTADAGTGGSGTPPTAEEEKNFEEMLADQFVGDYVVQLENFVEYYNIDYPSHDGDDTVIISLKDDVLARGKQCTKESPNLLFYSGDLTRSDGVTQNGKSITRGWTSTGCDLKQNRCLQLLPQSALPFETTKPEANLPPAQQVNGGATWLLEAEVTPFPSDGGIADAGFDLGMTNSDGAPLQKSDASQISEVPARAVLQTIELNSGTYVLSWYDQARTPDGHLAEQASTLQVNIYKENWELVESHSFVPHIACSNGTCTSAWGSERQALGFTLAVGGVYRIAFSPSTSGESRGSVVLADVQLESAQSMTAPPGPYVGNGSTRSYVSSDCTHHTAAEVQAAFAYLCQDKVGCYYELAAPMLIDTGIDNSTGKSSVLGAKFAKGNFNFRHIDLAVNLAGTGVFDCSGIGTNSCYGQGYVEYTLAHDAYNAGILGYDNRVQEFNFGSASIFHGKALTAERFLTMPMSSADQGLISQQGLLKTEFRGRPIDGTYRLRIWDSPGLSWDRLEDVQIVLKYRYWSPISASP